MSVIDLNVMRKLFIANRRGRIWPEVEQALGYWIRIAETRSFVLKSADQIDSEQYRLAVARVMGRPVTTIIFMSLANPGQVPEVESGQMYNHHLFQGIEVLHPFWNHLMMAWRESDLDSVGLGMYPLLSASLGEYLPVVISVNRYADLRAMLLSALVSDEFFRSYSDYLARQEEAFGMGFTADNPTVYVAFAA